MKQYGISNVVHHENNLEAHIENIKLKGFSLVKGIVSKDDLVKTRSLLDSYYQLQEEEFGRELMKSINELNTFRTPLYYDSFFIKFISNIHILEIVKSILGKEVILHLQNGIINLPNKEHHQSSWHRDLPYQEFTISKPLGLSVFYCIDEFNTKTGSTILLPYSHQYESFPTLNFAEENEFQIKANAGDVLIFDSMLFHKAGYNSSEIIRRGINNVFVAPLLKQQINLPKFLNGKYADDKELYSLLGYKYDVAESVMDYRSKKLKK